jgi:hypothetical protein
MVTRGAELVAAFGVAVREALTTTSQGAGVVRASSAWRSAPREMMLSENTEGRDCGAEPRYRTSCAASRCE